MYLTAKHKELLTHAAIGSGAQEGQIWICRERSQDHLDLWLAVGDLVIGCLPEWRRTAYSDLPQRPASLTHREYADYILAAQSLAKDGLVCATDDAHANATPANIVESYELTAVGYIFADNLPDPEGDA